MVTVQGTLACFKVAVVLYLEAAKQAQGRTDYKAVQVGAESHVCTWISSWHMVSIYEQCSPASYKRGELDGCYGAVHFLRYFEVNLYFWSGVPVSLQLLILNFAVVHVQQADAPCSVQWLFIDVIALWE